MINKRDYDNLTDKEIIKMIINYVDEDIYGYAVMIDGEWGCGKTYFIKESLCDELEKHEKDKAKKGKYTEKKIAYLSLYGVKSVDEISKQLFMEVYLSRAGKAKSVLKKGAKSVFPLLFDVLKSKGLELNPENMSDAVEGFLSIRDCILIFDDLERCACPINEILGYINKFVEHDDMKVIIVANQKELGKSTYLANQELKYLVAAHKNIRFEGKAESKFCKTTHDDLKEDQEPVDLSVVRSRMDKLFGQDEIYEKVKEKLIGITIYYHPALKEVFTKLINNKNINADLQKLLSDKISFFVEYMDNGSHLNIRTFQFFLSRISVLYETIIKMDEEGRDQFLENIIVNSFKACVCYKNGKLEYTWKESEEYEFRNLGNAYFFGNDLTFRFVDDFIMKSILDKERVKEMFEMYVGSLKKLKNKQLTGFEKLESQWYLSTDEEVESQIEEVLKDLGENKYEVKSYARIISLLINLEEEGFPKKKTETAISKMKENIENLNYHAELDRGYCPGDNEKKRERYTRIMQELQNVLDKRFQKQISEIIDQYLSMGDGWAEELKDYVRRNKQKIKDNGGFLSQIDIECLIAKIGSSNSYDINAFRACIIDLYINNSIGNALKEDGEKIDKLLEKVQKMDTAKFDRIKKMQIRYLIMNLEKAKEACKN